MRSETSKIPRMVLQVFIYILTQTPSAPQLYLKGTFAPSKQSNVTLRGLNGRVMRIVVIARSGSPLPSIPIAANNMRQRHFGDLSSTEVFVEIELAPITIQFLQRFFLLILNPLAYPFCGFSSCTLPTLICIGG